MRPKTYSYKDIDGNHWPDAPLGEEGIYSIYFYDWLQKENEKLIGVGWEIPEGIEASDEFVENEEAYIKLKPLRYGSFKITCYLKTVEKGHEQIKAIPMILKVY